MPVLPFKLLQHTTVLYHNGDFSSFEAELRLGGLDCMGALVSLLFEQYRLVEAFSIMDSYLALYTKNLSFHYYIVLVVHSKFLAILPNPLL